MPVTVEKKELIRNGRVFDITVEHLRFPGGHTVALDIIRHPGAAAIVAIDDLDQVVLLRQYRHAIGDDIWEIPAGTCEPGEAPLSCAQRELLEETGFTATHWRRLGITAPVPAYADEKIHLFLASDLTQKQQNLDPDEIVRVEKKSLKQITEMVCDGRIYDAKTVAALFLVMGRRGAIVL